MIKDIISFVTANQKFAIDFQTTPIILRANDYIKSKQLENLMQSEKVHFEGEVVELIDLGHILELGNSIIGESSRLLVGEIDGRMYGLLVDKVIEIINLNGDRYEFQNVVDSDGQIDLLGKKLKVIDINNLLKSSKIKISTDNI
jgi:chemotaxis signal transduction protein